MNLETIYQLHKESEVDPGIAVRARERETASSSESTRGLVAAPRISSGQSGLRSLGPSFRLFALEPGIRNLEPGVVREPAVSPIVRGSSECPALSCSSMSGMGYTGISCSNVARICGPGRSMRRSSPAKTCRPGRSPDHRRMYLDYEGEVSGQRGSVRRVDSGTYRALAWSARPRSRRAGGLSTRWRSRPARHRAESGGTESWIFRMGNLD